MDSAIRIQRRSSFFGSNQSSSLILVEDEVTDRSSVDDNELAELANLKEQSKSDGRPRNEVYGGAQKRTERRNSMGSIPDKYIVKSEQYNKDVNCPNNNDNCNQNEETFWTGVSAALLTRRNTHYIKSSFIDKERLEMYSSVEKNNKPTNTSCRTGQSNKSQPRKKSLYVNSDGFIKRNNTNNNNNGVSRDGQSLNKSKSTQQSKVELLSKTNNDYLSTKLIASTFEKRFVSPLRRRSPPLALSVPATSLLC